jgi:hypothetical protein
LQLDRILTSYYHDKRADRRGDSDYPLAGCGANADHTDPRVDESVDAAAETNRSSVAGEV